MMKFATSKVGVVDPGFPGAPTQRWGRKPIILKNFSRKLHEIEEKMDREGARV